MKEHPLGAILRAAAAGTFPPADGATDVLPPDPDGTIAVVAFTGHAYVLADVAPEAVAGGGFGGAMAPDVLTMLAGADADVGSVDVVLVAPTQRAVPVLAALPGDHPLQRHPRVERARQHRRDVTVFGDDDGVVIVGRGLVGRRELSVELADPDGPGVAPGSGAGRRLITAGLAHVPPGEACWAQVAAGNARSLRAFLGAGFVPVCGVGLIAPRHDG